MSLQYSPVHVRTDPDLEIPACVLAYLSRGGKFAADKQTSSVQKVMAEIHHFERSLHTAAQFSDKDPSRRSEFSRCRVPRKQWQPQICPQISRYIRLLKDNLCSYTPCAMKSNESLVDRAARTWLHEHRDRVAVIDADKNLGDVVLERRWVEQTCYKLLAQASVPVTAELCQQAMFHAKATFDSLIMQAASENLIPAFVRDFMTSKFTSSTVGSFRIRVKIHKEPMNARPVMNLSRSWLGPIATFLTVALTPATKDARHVVQSSWQLQMSLAQLSVPDGFELCTLDIRNLYPSIDHCHFMLKFSERVRRYWRKKPSFANFLVRLTGALLAFQFITFEGSLWQIRSGFATGLQAGVVLANVYLAELDDALQAHCVDIACPLALCWFRFIDDGLAIVKCGMSDHIKFFLNSWHPKIQWDCTAVGQAVPYLDLRISVADCGFRFATFRKEQNSYSYLPRSSCHPKSVFSALISGEAVRLFRQNSQNPCTLSQELDFFVDRLGRRGYNKDEARRLIRCTLRKLRDRVSAKLQAKRKLCFFKQVYTSSLNIKTIKAAVKRDWHTVQRLLPFRCDVLLSFRIQHNDFRRNYATTWLKSARKVNIPEQG